MKKEDPCPPLLTASEVARLLRIKTVTVHAAASDGRIPCVRLWRGKRRSLIRFRAQDIQRLVEGGEVRTKLSAR